MKDASESVKRVFSLGNATPREILKYRISEAVKKYQNNINDHGSAGVQCAAMSERIVLLMMHVKKYPQDKKAGRYLTQLISERRDMLNYLMRKDYHKFEWICLDYGLPVVHPRNAQHVRDKAIFENTYRKIF